jgi:pimeloyl-ACP methyl ester carboxylesterase
MGAITTSDGVALHYLDDGDPAGPPVVLIAGFRAPATSWYLQQPALRAAGHRVLSLDRRSHGLSDDPPSGHTMARHGEDLSDFLTALDLRSAILVGGSMGASTIWSYVGAFGTERVRAAVSVDQTPMMLNTDEWPYGFYDFTPANRDTYFASGIPSTGHSRKPDSEAALRIVKALDLSPQDLARGRGRDLPPTALALLHDHAVADWRGVVTGMDVPMLMVAARFSDYWPCEHAGACVWPGGLVEAAIIEDCGHAANIERPDEFNRILLDFIGRLS